MYIVLHNANYYPGQKKEKEKRGMHEILSFCVQCTGWSQKNWTVDLLLIFKLNSVTSDHLDNDCL